MEVLPTDWSPKKTNWDLAKGARDEEDDEAAEGRLPEDAAGAFMAGSFLASELIFGLGFAEVVCFVCYLVCCCFGLFLLLLCICVCLIRASLNVGKKGVEFNRSE